MAFVPINIYFKLVIILRKKFIRVKKRVITIYRKILEICKCKVFSKFWTIKKVFD